MAISMRLHTRRRTPVATATRLPRYLAMTKRTLFDKLRVPTLVCHCEEHSDVAISMRLHTRRRTAVASATRLPRRARNDKVGTHEVQRERGNVFG